MHIGGGEAEKTEAGVQEAVLPAVVLGEAVAMGATVVLDREPLSRVVEIGPAQEAAAFIVEAHLRLRPRQPGQNEEQAKARLHRRLGRRIRELDDLPELRDASPSRVSVRESVERRELDQPLLQRHVDGDHGVDERKPASEVGHGAQRRGRPHPAPQHHVAGG